MIRVGAVLGLVAATSFLPMGVRAQSPEDGEADPAVDVDGGATKAMRPDRVSSGGIRLDGLLDDDAWTRAAFRSDFLQRGDARGFEPRARTAVAFVQDDEALYVAARMEAEPGADPRPLLDRRDEAGSTERILVSLDTYQDRATSFTFGVTIGGVRLDYLTLRDRENSRDEAYDPVWTARVARDSTGWSAEMRIPFSQLRFTPGVGQSWGLNVRRWNPTSHLNVYWVMVPFRESGWVSRFGTLYGVDARSGGPGMEIVPYARGRVRMLDPTVGGGSEPETQLRAGGDLKIGVRANMTLDVTLNPDFGQVEADPARINLTAFETFFPERRPFFLEGQALFRSGGPTWFYSRRVGSLPLSGSGDRFERIESARVLGGAKLTGRMPSGLSVGALAAVTDRERVALADSSGTREVSPLSAFGIGRIEQEMGSAGSFVGGTVTAVERFFASEDGYLDERLARRALTGGLDWTLRFGQGAFEMTGFGGGSYVAGSPAAMTRLQLSSTHYLQRPDAEHVGVDPEADFLMGWTAGLRLAQIGGAHWRWNVDVAAVSPAFEIRDAGSQARADRIEADFSASYGVRDGRGKVRNRRVGVGLATAWNFGGDRLLLMPSTFLTTNLSGAVSTSLQVGMRAPALSDDLTRGGPLMETPQEWWAELGLASTGSDRGWWSGDLTMTRDGVGGWSGSAGFGAGVPVTRWLELSVFASALVGDASRQFVTSLDGGPAETFGRRYVFSSLERRELLTQLRAKLALAPDAVLTLYAEPFVGSGRAHRFGELAAARSSEVRPFESIGTVALLEDGARLITEGGSTFRVENFDYHVRSFRGTGVFRWEWRGSTLFLIWQKSLWRLGDRWGSVAPGDLIDALGDPGQDMAVVKLSLRFGAGR